MSDLSNVELAEVSEHTAHTILNYCITQAVRTNKNHSFKVQIPYSILAKAIGKSEQDCLRYLDVSLHLTVDLQWAQHDSDDVELDIG